MGGPVKGRKKKAKLVYVYSLLYSFIFVNAQQPGAVATMSTSLSQSQQTAAGRIGFTQRVHAPAMCVPPVHLLL